MDLLKDLLQDGEIIATYGLTGSYSSYNCIIEEGSDDISGALEDTLHRIIESGNEDELYSIMGAFIPSDEEMDELEEFDEYVSIDLGYILGGLITHIEFEEESKPIEKTTEEKAMGIIKDFYINGIFNN